MVGDGTDARGWTRHVEGASGSKAMRPVSMKQGVATDWL